MKKIVDIIIKYKFYFIISFLCICLLFLVIYIILKNNNTEESISSVKVSNPLIENKEEVIKIYVDVKGYVNKPGVYELNNGIRVIDAIKAAGDLKKGANTRFVNLSKKLNDGDVIVIYSNSEIDKAKKDNIIYVDTPCVCEEVKNDACYKEETSESGLININTADSEELMSLDGIGESKAKAIIEYRKTNGLFKSIEDIVNVNGISETIYTKIKTNITV